MGRNLAAIELHTSLARAPRLTHPTSMVFDLDPGAPAGLHECCEVALVLRGLFDSLGARVGGEDVRRQGAAGLRAARRQATFAETKAFSRQIAELLAARRPIW